MTSGTPINEKIRNELKVPVGHIVQDQSVRKEIVAPYFVAGKWITVSVGDRTTERFHEFGLSCELEIVDSLEKRSIRQAPSLLEGENRVLLGALNPPGVISQESLDQLAKSLKLIVGSGVKVRLEIKGEEDLLALPVIAFFPERTVTFYGQPNVGLVIVTSVQSREKSRRILKEMGIESLRNDRNPQ